MGNKREGSILLLVHENIFIANDESNVSLRSNYLSFRTPKIKYHSYCDDFGPMNATSIFDFIRTLDDKVRSRNAQQKVVYVAEDGVRGFTNAVFLMGCYLILKLKMEATAVWDIFSGVPPEFFEGYRDATFTKADFRLSLLDCWQGVARAQSYGWIDCPENMEAKKWGAIDPEEYEHYEDPLNGNLNIVVPGKFVAFQGPEELRHGKVYRDSPTKGRSFAPKYYCEIFDELNVKDIVRLNEPMYEASTFQTAGINVHELEFEDCTSPPPDVVSRFMEIADAAPGLIAVHCKAGLGRTGTLIALYMIRTYNFSAREAMGWLRIMRPGSVIGEQQHYLCEVEIIMRGLMKRRQAPPALSRCNTTPSPTPTPPPFTKKKWSSIADMGTDINARTGGRLPPLPSQRGPLSSDKDRSPRGESDPAVMAAVITNPRRLQARIVPLTLERSRSAETFPAPPAAIERRRSTEDVKEKEPASSVTDARRRSAEEAKDVTAALARRSCAAAGPGRRKLF